MQARQQQLYARTQLQGTYHKQREGSYGHFGPHPLWRALVSPTSAACVSQPRGVGTPAKLAHTADCRKTRYILVPCPSRPSEPYTTHRGTFETTGSIPEKAQGVLTGRNLIPTGLLRTQRPATLPSHFCILSPQPSPWLSQPLHGERRHVIK